MRTAVLSNATPSASAEVNAPEIVLNKEDSRSSNTGSKRVSGGPEAVATVQKERPPIVESHHTTAPSVGGPEAVTTTVARSGLPPMRRSPRKHPAQTSNAPGAVSRRRDKSMFVSASTLFPPPAKSIVMEKTEVRDTADAGGEPLERSAPTIVMENANLNLRTSKLPVNTGVPYSPNRRIVKEVATEVTDTAPVPTNKPDEPIADDAGMFVDLSPLDSAQQLAQDPDGLRERHPIDFTPPSCILGIDRSADATAVQDPMPVAFAFPADMVPMMAQPILDGRKAVKFAEPIVQATPLEISPSLKDAYRRIEDEALYRRSSRVKGQSSSNVTTESVFEDTIKSAMPGSVRQIRVVHAPRGDDYEPVVKATKEQNQLYDILKRFGNARSNNKHMKELRASCLDRTKIV
ncbi:uncharacterized protein [Triticum aestivum]|uniref:uncharacterized protein n=1 Tax=Triticum aestivum TaxID=4565 RepID=UPI001D009C15|nr:uncharacterized protein LOC123093895 [Triticum aestivum]